MPEKPTNNDSEKRSEDSPSDSSNSDLDDGIDHHELEPILSRLPRKKAADNIPSKPAPPKESELSDEEIDSISLNAIDIEENSTGSLDADSKDEPDDQRKPTSRMYPSGKAVNLSPKPEEIPTSPMPESNEKELPSTAAESDESPPDDDIKELIIDHEPLPDEASKKVAAILEEEESKANSDQPEASEQENTGDSPPSDEDKETGANLIQEHDFEDKIRANTPTSKKSENSKVKKQVSISVVEKVALGTFLLLFIIGVAIYVPQMIPEGQLTNNIVDVADTPLEFDGITIEALEGRWIETAQITSRVRRGVEWTPEVEIAISGSDSGALRVLFLDQDGRQRGDTMDIAFASGKFQPSNQSSEKIYCTHGFSSELELKDLRARGDSWWTVRVLKGQDLKAPSSEFETMVEMKIPFEIVVSEN